MTEQDQPPTPLVFEGIEGVEDIWRPNRPQTLVAWDMLIALGTRVPLSRLSSAEGSDREVMASLYALFSDLRRLLQAGGSDLGSIGEGTISMAGIVGATLNFRLRPFLTRWHPQLLDHEATAAADQPPIAWERTWDKHVQFRHELDELGEWLASFANLLAAATDGSDFLNRAL